MKRILCLLLCAVLMLTTASAEYYAQEDLLGQWEWSGSIAVTEAARTTFVHAQYQLTLDAQGQGTWHATREGIDHMPITWSFFDNSVVISGVNTNINLPISIVDGVTYLVAPNGQLMQRMISNEPEEHRSLVMLTDESHPSTSKEIKFRNYKFGDTFKNIRTNTRLYCIDYLYGRQSARVVADALYYFAERDRITESRILPSCFFARTSETFKIVGYDVGTMLWFVYPTQNGVSRHVENDAIFYAAFYEFHSWDDLVSIHGQVKEKLTDLYGEPYHTGTSLDEPMGRMPISTSVMDWYASDNAKYKPEYTMWHSSENGAVAVLSFWYDTGINEHKLKLAYVSDAAEATFDQLTEAGQFGILHFDDSSANADGL